MDRRTVLKALALSPLAGLGWRPAFADARDYAAEALAANPAPAVGGAVFSADAVLWSGVAGVRRAGSDDRVTMDDKWHLGSNAKAMTAAVFQRLVEQGRIAADATLETLFPGVAVDKALKGLTADHLSSHSAGLSDAPVIDIAWLMVARGDTRPLPVQRAELAAKALGAPPPGTVGAFAYANINFVVLGAAIEAATGQSWEDIMQTEMFAPLGMASAGFGAPADPAPWGHRAGRPMEPGIAADNPPALGPAGTVHMNLSDYGTWLQTILKGGAGWLSAEAVAAMTAPPAEGEVYRRGWGLIAERPWAKGHVLAHEGSNTMWHALVLVAPRRGLAVATVSNDLAEGAKATRALAQTLTEAFAPG